MILVFVMIVSFFAGGTLCTLSVFQIKDKDSFKKGLFGTPYIVSKDKFTKKGQNYRKLSIVFLLLGSLLATLSFLAE